MYIVCLNLSILVLLNYDIVCFKCYLMYLLLFNNKFLNLSDINT